ncbi:MAG: nicotinate-nucleotide--dimethylbenzimidazole phosphoribosyltransferase [Leptospirales bacterium]|nr:nicotinate-nucleotide--dimethylbenzimidazole phosphoribosyltransferase [Leptospirales bacterium]
MTDQSPDGFSQHEREGVYRAIYERRDVRAYRSEPVREDIIRKLLDAAHHAPSVGFMQPWNFLLISDPEIRRTVYDHFMQMNSQAGENYEGERKLKYSSLKLQGILDAPVNVVFTCDRERGGKNVLGRNTIRDTDIYSTCLAIENFWLAARAEGLGVGWMSIMETAFLKELLRIPDQVLPIAYLTLGYPVSFPDSPLLESVGWRKRENLADLIFDNVWGNVKRFTGSQDLPTPQVEPIVSQTIVERMNHLTKPRGSLGDLEKIILRIASIQRQDFPSAQKKNIILFAGDHGITEEQVSAYNQHVTAQMMYQYIAGTAAVNSFARSNGIDLLLCDVGVNHDFEGATGLLHRKVRHGTRNFLRESAMTREEFEIARKSGYDAVHSLSHCDLLGLGEMGIGNTTPSAAIASVLLGISPEDAVGRGTGVGNTALERKLNVIRNGLALYKSAIASGEDAIVCFGGFEIAALQGAIEAAFEKHIPVVLDGLMTGVAALVASQKNPGIRSILIAGHLSAEPAHRPILEALGLSPVLDLKLRLGEGSGAALAMGIISNGCSLFREMKTFEEANIHFAENEAATT